MSISSGFEQYIKKDSIFHRLNPFSKLLIAIMFLFLIFTSSSIFINVLLIASLLVVYILSAPKIRSLLNLLIVLVVIFIVLLLVNWIIMKSPGLAIFDITKNNFLNFNIENYTHRVKDLAPDVNISENLVYNVGENYFNKSITEVFFISTEHNKSVIADYFNKTYLMPGQQYYEYKIIFGYVGSSNNLHHYIYFFYQSNWYTISQQTIFYSLNVALKIFMSVTVVTLLVSTTSNIELTYAISCLLMPFKVLKLPIMEWTMIISLALRFIPTLLSESERILYAQASRGVDFKNGNFRDKAVGLISLIIPMFLISFNKSNELANALDVRNFNTNNIRSQYRYFTVSPIDFIILLCVSVIFALTLFFSIFNVTFSLFSISDIVLKFMQS